MPKKQFHDTRSKPDRAIVVAVYPPNLPREKVEEYLEEQNMLVHTKDAEILQVFIQRFEKPVNSTYVGSGKLLAIKDYVKENEIDVALFDDDLTPSQIRNLERSLNCKIVDKSMLILDIFAQRAKTVQAKTQVELAQLQYILPRLTRMWTHLERQKGGIGFRGPGESQIESDRRLIMTRISLLKKNIEKIEKQELVQRKQRNQLPRLAFVGYTNAGKSSLLNAFSKSDVYVKNQLFATLDTTVRKIVLDNHPMLLSDTVGFIRKLPHLLIESFKSTLNEAKEADLLINVVDISNESFTDHIEVVDKTLVEIGASSIPKIIVFNKIDVIEKRNKEQSNSMPYIQDYKQNISKMYDLPIFFTTIKDANSLNELKKYISKFVETLYTSEHSTQI